MPPRRAFALILVLAGLGGATHFSRQLTAVNSLQPHAAVLGFDRNEYPSDAAMAALRKRFAFSGYWLNAPPGSTVNTWTGKRESLRAQGFGFLVLFNGQSEKEIKRAKDAANLGKSGGQSAVDSARREGFHPSTLIFLDQEEGGRMLPDQRAYIHAWVDAVNAAGFRAGVYCSGMPADEGHGVTVVTAQDIRANAGGRSIQFFVYNDACPPSPGCVLAASQPAPSASGVEFAAVWQFAQSPRRHEYTRACAATYAAEDKCYSQLKVPETEGIFLDLDTAAIADPSGGRN